MRRARGAPADDPSRELPAGCLHDGRDVRNDRPGHQHGGGRGRSGT
jgi:hypothetical protein